jgi:hypothetical protein
VNSNAPTSYEPRAQIDRAPLPPPEAHASPSTFPNERVGSPTPEQLGWQASPRWSAVKGDGCIEVEPDPQDPLKPGEIKRC